MKTIVGHFKRSSTAKKKLFFFQKSAGATIPKKILQDVPTRWNSTFYMLERFIELEDAIRSSVALLHANLPILRASDWNVLKQLHTILKPFEEATKQISGEKYMTASFVIPVTAGLKKVCNKMKQTLELGDEIKQVLQELRKGLDIRFANIEYSNTFAICTFLDPRFESIGFEEIEAANTIKKKIINLISEIMMEINPKQPSDILQQDDNQNSNKSNEFSIWHTYDQNVISHKPQGTASSRVIIEVQRDMEEEILDRKKNALEWWKQHQYNYPYLKQLVQEKCWVLGTSVPCERLFSKAGNILTDRRNRLSANKVSQLLTLNSNSQYIE